MEDIQSGQKGLKGQTGRKSQKLATVIADIHKGQKVFNFVVTLSI
jgi:hypothetical protein